MTPPKRTLVNSEFIGVAYMVRGEGLCGGLNVNGPYLFPPWLNSLGRIRRCGLVRGGLSLRVGFEVSNATLFLLAFSLSFCLVPGGQDINSQLLL